MRKLLDNKRILVVRTDAIGDTLLSTPVLQVLKERFPKSHIAMLIRPYTEGIVSGNPYLDEIIFDDIKNKHKGITGFLKLVNELRNKKFDLCIVLHPTTRIAFLIYLSGIPIRVGTGYRFYQFLFNRKIYEHRSSCEKHELEYNLNMLSAIGIEVDAKKYLPILTIPDSAEQKIESLFKKWNINNDEILIGIHPGSGGSARDWSKEKYTELINKLATANFNLRKTKIIITGGPGEGALINAIKSGINENSFKNVIFTVDELNLKELSALIKKCSVFISNSTGPMHIATVVGVPTIAIFCPIIACSPKRWGPTGSGHTVIVPNVSSCKKCVKEKCTYWDCMERITVDDVLNRINLIIHK